MQADEVQNAKEPIAAQIDLSGQTLSPVSRHLWPVKLMIWQGFTRHAGRTVEIEDGWPSRPTGQTWPSAISRSQHAPQQDHHFIQEDEAATRLQRFGLASRPAMARSEASTKSSTRRFFCLLASLALGMSG